MDPGAALYLAAKKGDATRVRALFAGGADVHCKPVRAPLEFCSLLPCPLRMQRPVDCLAACSYASVSASP